MKISTHLSLSSSTPPHKVWARWLNSIVAAIVMLLLPSVAQATDYYLVGDFSKSGTNWNLTNSSYNLGTGNTATFTFKGNELYAASNNGTINFLIHSSGGWYIKPASGQGTLTANSGNSITLSSDYNDSGEDGKLTGIQNDANVTYTFTVTKTGGKEDWNEATVTVTSQTAPYSYKTNNASSWANITNNTFTVKGSDLPIQIRETADGGNVKYFVTGTNTNKIYTFLGNKISDNYTLDATEANATHYNFQDAVSTLDYIVNITPGDAGGTITMFPKTQGSRVFVKYTGDNTNLTLHVWAWVTGTTSSSTTVGYADKWPGDAMMPITLNGEQWYVWYPKNDITSFNFNINDGNNQGIGHQTVDLTANSDVYYYYNGNVYAQQTHDPSIITKSGIITDGSDDNVNSLYFRANFKGTGTTDNWSCKQMTPVAAGVYRIEINGSDLASGSNHFRLPFTSADNKVAGLAAQVNSTPVPVNDAKGTNAIRGDVGDDDGNFKFANETNKYNKYYVEAVHTSEGWKVAITTDGIIKDHYEISYDDGDSWTWLNLDADNKVILYKSGFFLRKVTSTGTTFLVNSANPTTTSESTITSSGISYVTNTDFTKDNGNNTTTILGTKYSFEGTDNGYGWTLTVSDNSLSASQNTTKKRYLVLSANNHTKAYPFYPSRARDGKDISLRQFTRNLKSDNILKEFSISSGTSVTTWVSSDAGGNNKISTRDITFNPTDKHSYTWYWDDRSDNETVGSDASDQKYWHIVDNYGANGNGEGFSNQDTYYLIGNMESASHYVDIDPKKAENVTKLTRYVYNGGVGTQKDYSDADNSADSIVYRCVVPRPSEGWGELYLAVANGDPLKNWDPSTSWNHVIRPQVQTYNYQGDTMESGGSVGHNGVDATALEGGLFKSNGWYLTKGNDNNYYIRPEDGGQWTRSVDYKFDEANRNQALNPLVSAHIDAPSYIFSMNVTYHTYRIIFQDVDKAMYIVGPAVNYTGTVTTDASGKNGTGDGTTTATINDWMGTGIKLTWDKDAQCYRYLTGADLQEHPIKMKAGQPFRFVTGKDFTNAWYGEDNTVPNYIHGLNNDYKLSGTNVYSKDGKNDTQYLNYLTAFQSSQENRIMDSNQSITYGLGNRDETDDNIIRLYIKHINGEDRVFYTIQRTISFDKFDQAYDLIGQGGQKLEYWRVFSDYNAHRIPAGVKVFVVSDLNFNYDSSTSQIGTATIKDISNLGYIPANTGVLLGCDGSLFANKEDQTVLMDVYGANPNATYDGANLLKPAVEKKSYSSEQGMFTFDYHNGHAGFYYPRNGLVATHNSCYLSYTGNTTQAKRFQGLLAFSFGDIVNDATTTGITDIEKDVVKDEPYYTLSGVRLTTRPSAPGIYVHNGKKVVIK